MVGSASPIAAFFDLDGTILAVNSARLWVAYERRGGRISRAQLAQAAIWLIGYRFGVLDIESALERAIAIMAGEPEDEMKARVRAWYDDEVADAILPAARRVLEAHRAMGHHLVLLTSSSPYISACIKEELGLHDVLCTRMEVENGVFTGKAVKPLCFGEGKVVHADSWARRTGVSLERSYFYTDSLTDLPMLEAVGHPRAVNPDPRLRRVAWRRRWVIEQWDREGPAGEQSARRPPIGL